MEKAFCTCIAVADSGGISAVNPAQSDDCPLCRSQSGSDFAGCQRSAAASPVLAVACSAL